MGWDSWDAVQKEGTLHPESSVSASTPLWALAEWRGELQAGLHGTEFVMDGDGQSGRLQQPLIQSTEQPCSGWEGLRPSDLPVSATRWSSSAGSSHPRATQGREACNTRTARGDNPHI